MAKIPEYESQTSLTTRPAANRQDPADAGQSGRNLQALGNRFLEISDKFSQLRDLQQVTDASTEANRQLNDIYLKAQQDPDIWNPQKYQREIQRVRDTVGKNIFDAEARLRFQSQFESAAGSTYFNIQKDARSKQVDASKASLVNALDQYEKQYTASGTDQEKKMIRTNMETLLDQYATAGVVSREDVATKKIALRKNLVMSEVKSDLAKAALGEADIDQVIAKLESGQYENAIGEQLDSTEKLELRDLADRYKKRQEKEIEEAKKELQEQSLKSAMLRIFDKNDQYTLIDAQDDFAQGKISIEQYEKLEDRLTSEKAVKARTDVAVYNMIRQAQLSGQIDGQAATPDQINQLILEKSAAGLLSDPDSKTLLEKTIGDVTNRTDELVKLNEEGLKSWGQQTFFGAEVAWDQMPVQTQGKLNEMIYKFHRRVDEEQATGSRIDEIAEEVKREYIKTEHPELGDVSDIPHVVVGLDGKVKRLLDPKQKTKMRPVFSWAGFGGEQKSDKKPAETKKEGSE